jgi:hypothetical protein
MITLQTSFKPLLLKDQFRTTLAKGEGGVEVEVTVNSISKEENFLDFCPNYGQEFGLWPLSVDLFSMVSG